MVGLIKALAGSFGASLCFALLFNTPRRCLGTSSLVGMGGYAVYMLVYELTQSAVGANFVGALIVDVLAEILARKQKAPAVLFSLIGVVPLVPGAGLYRTMLALVLKDYALAVSIGVETMLISGCIALAIAIVTLFARNASQKKAIRATMRQK